VLRPPGCTLFPSTTLFRSRGTAAAHLRRLGCILAGSRQGRRGGVTAAFPFPVVVRYVRTLYRLARARALFRQWPWRGPMLKRLRSEEHTSELQSRFDLVCR